MNEIEREIARMSRILDDEPKLSSPKKTTKNLCSKTRPQSNPYEVWRNDFGWEWLVLKKWQADDDKQYARWFCAVKSPYSFGRHELGDVYVKDIKGSARRVK